MTIYEGNGSGRATPVVYAGHGYHVVVQSVRGTFGSGGLFDPMANEADDGQDAVAWLRTQPWFDGRLATSGPSYLGWTQWALLTDPPPELRTAVILVGPHDMSDTAYGTGAFFLEGFLSWSEMITQQEQTSSVQAMLRTMTVSRRLAPDLFVRLCDVDPEGHSRNFSDAHLRLDPASVAEQAQRLEMRLDACAHRLPAGHRLRLQVSGGSHPRYSRNEGTGAPPGTGTGLRPCIHTIWHAADAASRIVLPVAR